MKIVNFWIQELGQMDAACGEREEVLENFQEDDDDDDDDPTMKVAQNAEDREKEGKFIRKVGF